MPVFSESTDLATLIGADEIIARANADIRAYVAPSQGQALIEANKAIIVSSQGNEAEATFDVVEGCGVNLSTAIVSADILFIDSDITEMQSLALRVLRIFHTFRGRSLLPEAPPRIRMGSYGEGEGTNASLVLSITYRLSL